ncbi:protein serine/threonine phosphatase 2C [Dentipellis sp. KUC8613]|nr:protein serine/threonine phosphatase 2C [Dentipellis sp. KUC8613]
MIPPLATCRLVTPKRVTAAVFHRHSCLSRRVSSGPTKSIAEDALKPSSPRQPLSRTAVLATVTLAVLVSAYGLQAVHLDSLAQPDAKAHVSSGPATDDPKAVLRQQKSLEHFNPARKIDLNARLREYEETHVPDARTGVQRYDMAQFSSNEPTEDDHTSAILPIPSGYWSLFALFDGHSGWETSAWLRENMIPALAGALADLFSHYRPPDDAPPPPAHTIDATIQDTFALLDDDIVFGTLERAFKTDSKADAINVLAPAYAGACALLAFYDSESRVLRVALTGDSRAVLGRRIRVPDPNNPGSMKEVYEVRNLSVEQDGHNLAEEMRLHSEHPGERVVQGGRVLGLGPARAFGDALWKWPLDIQRMLKDGWMGRSPRSDVKTPPYLTARPEIVSLDIQEGDFVVLGTDGLWECLASWEVVGLVGAWAQKQAGATGESLVLEPKDLPLHLNEEDGWEDDSVRYRQWGAKKLFVNVDGNAATHLLRNALGGADEDITRALTSMRPPRKRMYIDDVTVTVVFFGQQEGSTGSVLPSSGSLIIEEADQPRPL